MSRSYLAGRLDPGGTADRRVARVVGPRSLVTAGPLACGVRGGGPPPDSPTVCLLDGRVTSLELVAATADLTAATPAEIVLARAYERLGEGLIRLLRGEFVLALVRRETRAGLVVRDPLGARSVFVHASGRAVTFASEVRDLLAMLDVQPPPDPVAVAHWLARTGTLPHATLHQGIAKLPAGHLLRLGPAGAERERWWSPRPAAVPIGKAEASARVGGLMRAAVARSLEAARNPAVMLSGGFDSASVAALAGVRAYSAVFPCAPQVDESAAIAAIRACAELDGVEIEVRGGSALRASLDFLAEWRMPSVSPNWFVWAPLLARARRDGVDVLLDGEGGDEVLGCAPYLIADRVAAGRLVAALRLARRLPGMGPRPRRRWIQRALLQYGVRGVIPHRLHVALRRARGRDRPPWLLPDVARLVGETDDLWRWKETGGPRWRAAFAAQLVDGPDALGVPEQLAREADLAGVELRHPYRDEELVENALSTPPQLSFDPCVDRPLARAAMRGLIPEVVRSSGQKVVFNDLLDVALAGVDRRAVGELLDEDAELRAYVDVPAARAALLDGDRRPQGWALDVWRLVTLECWLQLQRDPGFATRMRELVPDGEAGASAPS